MGINKLESDNFEDKVVNRHEEYKNEVLYIFSLDVELTNTDGINENMVLYIKFNLLNPKVILVSFHKARYEFREKDKYGKEIL